MARAKYYEAGYTPPAGVGSATQVKEYQRMLGVDVDGIWGPDTQAAYDSYLSGKNGATGTQNKWAWGAPASGNSGGSLYDQYYQTIIGQLSVPSISVDVPSAGQLQEQWQAALRPGVDAAISRRQKASQAQQAELDADAVSRGMGGSSHLSSLKQREAQETAEDIADMEAQYGATLAERLAASLESYRQMELSAQQYNAQARQAAQQAAMSLAGNWYGDYMAQQNALQLQALNSAKSTGSTRTAGSSKASKSEESGSEVRVSDRLTASDYLSYVEKLSDSQRKSLFSSSQSYWKVRRDELIAALGAGSYQSLRQRYMGR